ncbi:hypothetical protein KIPB_000967 [Kipferlia bialata]|uniref:Uncharacterized protein n=1 Tax=Kipferlia bialata TaxID=797122 RepID=A0A9K3CPB5_9EUKA|nr:hypothetical protein KIPB_000967 [Kipferlia bialata]|eukprot:g967.t1
MDRTSPQPVLRALWASLEKSHMPPSAPSSGTQVCAWEQERKPEKKAPALKLSEAKQALIDRFEDQQENLVVLSGFKSAHSLLFDLHNYASKIDRSDPRQTKEGETYLIALPMLSCILRNQGIFMASRAKLSAAKVIPVPKEAGSGNPKAPGPAPSNDWSSCRHLDLSRLGTEGLEALLPLLRRLRRLEHLDLTGCGLTPASVSVMCHGCMAHLATLTLTGNNALTQTHIHTVSTSLSTVSVVCEGQDTVPIPGIPME